MLCAQVRATSADVRRGRRRGELAPRNFGINELAALVLEHVADDARDVALERHHDQVVHHVSVGRFVVRRGVLSIHHAVADGCKIRRGGHIAAVRYRRCCVDAQLGLPHSVEKFVDPLLVVRAHLRAQRGSTLEHGVEDALARRAALEPFHTARPAGGGAKQLVEHLLRIDELVQRLGRRFPRHAAAERARLAIARAVQAGQADLHRGRLRGVLECGAGGQHLIDGDTVGVCHAELRANRGRINARQPGAGLAPVLGHDAGAAVGVEDGPVLQPRDHRDLRLERRERLEHRRQRPAGPAARGFGFPKVGRAVRQIDRQKAQRCARGLRARITRPPRFEPGQRQRYTGATQHQASGKWLGQAHGSVSRA